LARWRRASRCRRKPSGGVMAFDNQLFALCHGLRRWAAATPSVKRMWIYGSRAAGTQRPDNDPNPSDLDIAVDIDVPESDSDTFRRGRFADWRTEVQAIVAPYHLHLEMYLGTPGVKERGRLQPAVLPASRFRGDPRSTSG